jgi:hypothetical protein
MITIIRDAEVSPGIWAYHVPSLALCGRSRQPLLDACRQIERALGVTAHTAGVFRDGSELPDIFCPVSVGALTTVLEPDKHRNVHFGKFRAFAGMGGR